MPRPRRYGSAERPLAPTAPARRPTATPANGGSPRAASLPGRRPGVAPVEPHPLTDRQANARLEDYEARVKGSFDRIVPVLKRLSALQHEDNFVELAQRQAVAELGHDLPPPILESAWVSQLDMRTLFAWCVFEAYEAVSAAFFRDDPLQGQEGSEAADAFNAFLLSCGFHLLDVSPCADGRLAHAIAYALRLPFGSVRRRPHAGAMFDVENTVDRWVRTEHLRYREGRPNPAHAPTRYLKAAVYHFSSRDPQHEGCAAHGSNDAAAAAGGLRRLQEFQQAVENSFCCGASVDLLLIGLDTDTDAIRIHVPDAAGQTDLDCWLDALDVHTATLPLNPEAARDRVLAMVLDASRRGSAEAQDGPAVDAGMARLIARLIEHNMSQIDFVRTYHNGAYADAGHAERFIGVGIGFKEIHLRNLTYFAHMDTVEEGAADLDVGVKIFKGLNVSRGLPVPVVVRFDYHGSVPGARERAILYCQRTDTAIRSRYGDLFGAGLLHTLLTVRDRDRHVPAETIGSSIKLDSGGGH